MVYHWKVKDFKGSSIVDLYTLKARMPELFAGSAAKYDTSNLRKYMLTNTMVPNLGTLWNGAVQTSTIHPQKILDAKRKHGIPIEGNTHMQEYFVIPVQRLLNDPKIKKMVHWNFPELTKTAMLGFVLNNQHLHGRLGEWNKQDYPVLDQVRGSVCSTACSRVLVFFEQAHLSKHTIMHVW